MEATDAYLHRLPSHLNPARGVHPSDGDLYAGISLQLEQRDLGMRLEVVGPEL